MKVNLRSYITQHSPARKTFLPSAQIYASNFLDEMHWVRVCVTKKRINKISHAENITSHNLRRRRRMTQK